MNTLVSQEEIRKNIAKVAYLRNIKLSEADLDELTIIVENKLLRKFPFNDFNENYFLKTINTTLSDFKLKRPKLLSVEELAKTEELDDFYLAVKDTKETGYTMSELLDYVLMELYLVMEPKEAYLFHLVSRGYKEEEYMEKMNLTQWQAQALRKKLFDKIEKLFVKYHLPFKKRILRYSLIKKLNERGKVGRFKNKSKKSLSNWEGSDKYVS